MILADLAAELDTAVRSAIAAGWLPSQAARAGISGSWDRPPDGAPGVYASSLPFELARLAGAEPARIAAGLAAGLPAADWISAAIVTGGGYLTITVTPSALAALAVRIATAGPGCSRSDALAGTTMTAPPLPDLAAEPDWQQAWQDQALALTGRLARAAGGTVLVTPEAKRISATATRPAPGPAAVPAAVAYGGADVVRYLLARTPPGRRGELAEGILVSNQLSDPAGLVRFAHSDTAAVQRWAAALGLERTEPDGRLTGLLAQPPERAILDQLSWLPERVASAARRRRPDEFPRYLEYLAAAWLDCREACPALPFGGRAAPRDAAGTSARLWLAEAARTVLATGLELIGIGPAGSSPSGRLCESPG